MWLNWGWWIKYWSSPFVAPNIVLWLIIWGWFWFWCWCWCWCWASRTSFCLRSSTTFRCEFECLAETNVGLAAGLYSGTKRPDLNLTPQALQSVLGPKGPVRHCGVFSEAQWRHFLPLPDASTEFSLFLTWALAGDRWRRRDDQSQGAARERLLLAFPGTETSALKIGEFL